MYTIISLNPDVQDSTEMGIWTDSLLKNGWTINEKVPGTCWKKFHGKDAYKDEFMAALDIADLVPAPYIIAYADHEPVVDKF